MSNSFEENMRAAADNYWMDTCAGTEECVTEAFMAGALWAKKELQNHFDLLYVTANEATEAVLEAHETLKRENERLKAECEQLRKTIKLQGEEVKGKSFTEIASEISKVINAPLTEAEADKIRELIKQDLEQSYQDGLNAPDLLKKGKK